MKQSKACPKCQSRRIGRLARLPDTQGKETETSWRVLGLTRADRQPIGQLEAYVCTTCGYLEVYVSDPRALPFEELLGFSWHEGGAAPYR